MCHTIFIWLVPVWKVWKVFVPVPVFIHGVWELIMQPQLTQTFLSACVESSSTQGRDIDEMQHSMYACEEM